MKKGKETIISFLVLIGVWQLYSNYSGQNTALFPSPAMVLKALKELWTVGLMGSTSHMTLLSHIIVSLGRFFTGYLCAVTSAILLGLFFGCLPKAFSYINPIIQIIRPVAPVAFMPFIVLWFGIGNIPAVVIIFIAGFFPVFLSTVHAVQQVEPVYLKVAKNFGLSRLAIVFRVILPAIFLHIMNSLRLALGTSWIFLVSGEMVGAQSGLGFLIMDSKNCIRMDSLLATILVIGMIGFTLDAAMRAMEHGLSERFGVS